MKNLEYIVSGTGRCGTTAAAIFLTRAGVPCGHESIFTPEGIPKALFLLNNSHCIKAINTTKVNWLRNPSEIIADSSFFSPPFLNHEHFCNSKIIHIVRHPLQVINSFVKVFKFFNEKFPVSVNQRFVSQYYDFKEVNNPCSMAALYYVQCNEMIERFSHDRRYFFFPIESSSSKLLNFIGSDKMIEFPKNINHWKDYTPTYKLSDIIDKYSRERLVEISKRYGYFLC